MRYVLLPILLFLLQGCSLKQGDLVQYNHDKYIFMQEMFTTHSMQCVEIGTIKKTKMNVKYCKSTNYANVATEGFLFHQTYTKPEERFIASSLILYGKKPVQIKCNSHVLNNAKEGDEYIVCFVAKNQFQLSNYILMQKNDVKAKLSTPIGNKEVYGGNITKEVKTLIKSLVDAPKDTKYIEKSL